MRSELNEYEAMCERLQKCQRGCNSNKYICAENAVKEYVGDDRKRLLQLKAQAEGGEYYAFSSQMIACAALIISLVDAILDFEYDGFLQDAAYIAKIIMIALSTLWIIGKVQKFNSVLKWRKYILVAIQEIEKDIDDIKKVNDNANHL